MDEAERRGAPRQIASTRQAEPHNEVLIKKHGSRPEPVARAARRRRRRGEAECAAVAGMTRIVEISRIREVPLRCFDCIRLETAAASLLQSNTLQLITAGVVGPSPASNFLSGCFGTEPEATKCLKNRLGSMWPSDSCHVVTGVDGPFNHAPTQLSSRQPIIHTDKRDCTSTDRHR